MWLFIECIQSKSNTAIGAGDSGMAGRRLLLRRRGKAIIGTGLTKSSTRRGKATISSQSRGCRDMSEELT